MFICRSYDQKTKWLFFGTLCSSTNTRRQNICAAGARLWNPLPVQLRNPCITYEQFERQLNGHLFDQPRTRRSLTSDIGRLRKTLTCTYLLTYLLIEHVSWFVSAMSCVNSVVGL